MKYLYPPIQPYAEHSVQVDSTHSLYVEECGRPDGIPVLFIHGGPGGGFSPMHRRFFNPEVYRIVLFDQRGCGKSRPHACLTNNTSAHLVEDIEKIRRLLGIEQWLLFGGSWGSTLALLYSETYPERVTGLILRGIFLCRQEDIAWFYQHGASLIYPDYWADFIDPINLDQRHNLISAYYQVLTGDNEVARMRAAEAWSVWEGRCSNLGTDTDTVAHFADPVHALAMARIECHYFYHACFIENNQILQNLHWIESLPLTIIQGRYDMVCPMNQAYALHSALPGSELVICEQAGHSGFEDEITQALVAATDRFGEQHYWPDKP